MKLHMHSYRCLHGVKVGVHDCDTSRSFATGVPLPVASHSPGGLQRPISLPSTGLRDIDFGEVDLRGVLFDSYDSLRSRTAFRSSSDLLALAGVRRRRLEECSLIRRRPALALRGCVSTSEKSDAQNEDRNSTRYRYGVSMNLL